MNYSVSQDTAQGAVNCEKLQSEIVAAGCATNLRGIQVQGDVLQILCDTADQAALDSIVHNHVAVSLDDNRNAKLEAIDNRTDEIIAGGFEFDSNYFSLSNEAQQNWIGMAVFQAALSWPVTVTTRANIGYSLSLLNLNAFIGAGMAVIKAAVDSGRALKIQCVNAQTQADLDAVVDNR